MTRLIFMVISAALVGCADPTTEIPVTEENFAVAESDRYFAEHSAEHPVNSIRHSREPSGPDNQYGFQGRTSVILCFTRNCQTKLHGYAL